MKKLCVLFLGVALCVPLFAGELTDAEMSGIYAGAVDVGINDVKATDSAAIAQSNIGAIAGGSAINANVNNTNFAIVANIVGDAAAAMQSNIGIIATNGSCGGNGCPVGVQNANINNTNKALVLNVSNDLEDGYTPTTIEGASIDVAVGESGGSINDTFARRSAVAAQSNIGVIAARAAVDGANVNNKNCAVAVNIPASVAAYLARVHHGGGS
jgi:hypothetical protein